MKLEPRPSPRYPELMVYRDGRIFDSVQMKSLNLVSIHQHSSRGPIAYWTTVGKTYNLDVLKMVFETYVSTEIIGNHWMIDFRVGDEIKPENLKKTKKHEKEYKEVRPVIDHDCWLNGHDCVYMW